MNNNIKDSGERREFETGARRDMRDGKGRMDLVPAVALLRLSRWYELGAGKYGDNNWQKGIPFSSYVDSAIRHLFKYLAGADDEDHLAAVIWNVMAIMYHQHYDQYHLQDLPHWKDRKTSWCYEIDLGNK